MGIDFHNGILKKLLLLLSLFVLSNYSNGQDMADIIKNKAIKLDKSAESNNNLLKLIENYKLIMVGEMHGTNEPAKFILQIANLLLQNKDSVQIGLEIPPEQLSKYLNHNTEENLFLSDFFSKKTDDGRASFAWAEIISEFYKNPQVRLFFYDINEKESLTSENRDSLMYLKIKKEIISFPNYKTVTLSGNIHNMILPYKNLPKMAYYLNNDKELNLSDKTFSVNHFPSVGTMINNIGKGLELREVNNSVSVYAQAVDYDSYILKFPKNLNQRYDGIYFTKKVSAAKMVFDR